MPAYARSTFTVNKRAKKAETELTRSQSQLCTESFDNCLVSLFEANDYQQPELTIQPYMKPGSEKRFVIHGLHVQTENDALLCVRGDSIRVSYKNTTHVGQIEHIMLSVSMGIQLELHLRPYYRCSDLDPYIDNEVEGELCIKSPDNVIQLNMKNATGIKRLQVVNDVSEHDSNRTTLVRRAYAEDNGSWCSLKDCVSRELQYQQQQRLQLESRINESNSDSDANDIPTDMCLLKHSFESDFGMRGFIDFLCDKDININDRLLFEDYIDRNYIEAAESIRDLEGATRLRQLSDSKDSYSLSRAASVVTDKCYLCGQVTPCAYMLKLVKSGQQAPLSRGCAKRLRSLTALKSFLNESQCDYERLTREQLVEKHEILKDLLYKIDRVLKRPICLTSLQ